MPRRIKIVQVSAQSGSGFFDDYDIQTPLNKRLLALQKANNRIRKLPISLMTELEILQVQ